MILLLDLFAYAAVSCPCHYSTGMIPVPFADREGDGGIPCAQGIYGAPGFLPTVFNHKLNLCPKSKITAM